jgi:hypothetical protein
MVYRCVENVTSAVIRAARKVLRWDKLLDLIISDTASSHIYPYVPYKSDHFP